MKALIFLFLFQFAIFNNIFSQVFSLNDCGLPANLQDFQIPNVIGGSFKPIEQIFREFPVQQLFIL